MPSKFSISGGYIKMLSLSVFVVTAFALAGCGSKSDSPSSSTPPAAATDPSGLTADELENGIGPVRTVELGEIDPAMVTEGAELFKLKCSACHKMGERYIGPQLDDVLNKRTAPYVMNMMLNPEEMTQRHPEARALLAEYASPMANQSLTVTEARAILEYLRSETIN